MALKTFVGRWLLHAQLAAKPSWDISVFVFSLTGALGQ